MLARPRAALAAGLQGRAARDGRLQLVVRVCVCVCRGGGEGGANPPAPGVEEDNLYSNATVGTLKGARGWLVGARSAYGDACVSGAGAGTLLRVARVGPWLRQVQSIWRRAGGATLMRTQWHKTGGLKARSESWHTGCACGNRVWMAEVVARGRTKVRGMMPSASYIASP